MNRIGGAVTTGVEAIGEDVVRIEVIVLPAVLRADIEAQAGVGGRQLDAVLAEVTRDRGISDVFLDG